MRPSRRLVLVPLLALFCALSLVSGARGATITGIADENLEEWSAATWSVFSTTGVKQVRHIVPWDTASNPNRSWSLTETQHWITDAEAHNLDILISFGHNSGEPFPSLVEYSKGVTAFREKFPQINKYTAFNEPNHHVKINPQGQTAAVTALNAADYWMALDAACHVPGKPPCEAIAGDFLDGSDATSFGNYIDSYKARLSEQAKTPSIWAVHPYSTMASGNRAALNVFMAKTEGRPVWFTEAGGMICNQGPGGGLVGGGINPAETNQVKSTQELQALLNYWGPVRVPRSYYYFLSAPWGGQVGCPNQKGEYEFDSALLAQGDAPRPAFSTAFPVALKPPTVQTTSASGLTPTQATLNGTVDPRGFHTNYRFDYGTTTSYGYSTTDAPAGFNPGAAPVSAGVGGLLLDTVYHYRVVASNAAGTTYGADQTFRTGTAGTPAVITDGAARWIYYRGVNGNLWQRGWNGSAWSTWDMGTPMLGNPAVVSQGSSRYIYFRGTDNHLYQWSWNEGQWGLWDTGNSIAGDPSAVTDGAARFVYFRGGDGQVWQFGWNGAIWSLWGMGDYTTDDPVAMKQGVQRFIYFRGTDGDLWQRQWSGSAWGVWDTGNPMLGDPSAITDGTSRSIYFRGTDSRIWQFSWSGTGWSMEAVGGSAVGNPVALQQGLQRLVYFRGSNGHMWQGAWAPGGPWGVWDMGPSAAGDAGVVVQNSARYIYHGTPGGNIWQLSWSSGPGWGYWDMGGM